MPSPDKALYDLLLSLFTPAQLQRLLTLEYGHEMAASLPVGGTPSDLAFAASQQLRRSGLIAPPLFAFLVEASPSRHADITAVARAFGLPQPPCASPPPPTSSAPAASHLVSVTATADEWDVFISYARADLAWVTILATNLHNLGLRVFFDEWEIGAGDVVSHRIDAGLRGSRGGVLVVSDTALARPWVAEEYASLLGSAVERGQRLIPILYDLSDLTKLPAGLRNRQWLDFRDAAGPAYVDLVDRLAIALRGQRRGPPPRSGLISPP